MESDSSKIQCPVWGNNAQGKPLKAIEKDRRSGSEVIILGYPDQEQGWGQTGSF